MGHPVEPSLYPEIPDPFLNPSRRAGPAAYPGRPSVHPQACHGPA